MRFRGSLSRCIAGILLIGVLGTTGCSLGALTYFLLPVEPSVKPPLKIFKGRNDRQKIAVLVHAPSNLRFGYDAIDNDIGEFMVREITTAEKRADVIPARKIRSWMDQNPAWADMKLQKIGEHFDVDYVILVDIHSFSLNESKNQFLLQGLTKVQVIVHDVHQNHDVLDEIYQREYPPNRSVPVSDVASEDSFKRKFLQTVARELSWYIVSHKVADEISDI